MSATFILWCIRRQATQLIGQSTHISIHVNEIRMRLGCIQNNYENYATYLLIREIVPFRPFYEVLRFNAKYVRYTFSITFDHL